MPSTILEREDIARDAAFNQVLHGNSAKARGGLTAMRHKNAAAQNAAVDEYFKHWDNKGHLDETEATREVSFMCLQTKLSVTNLTHEICRPGERNMPP